MDARRALADIQAGKELNDEFAGMSAHDVEQHISQMLAAAASVHSEVTESESIKVSPSLRSTIVPMADFASQSDYDVVQDHAQETTSAATIAESQQALATKDAEWIQKMAAKVRQAVRAVLRAMRRRSEPWSCLTCR